MNSSERQIKTTELTLGMFVSRLDRPWLESPFAFQGFTINSQSDIDTLQRSCQYVYVDPERGVCPSEITGCSILPEAKPDTAKAPPKKTLDDITHHNAQSSAAPSREEHNSAKAAYQQVEKLHQQIMTAIASKETLHIGAIGKQLLPLINCVKKNTDSMLQLIMLDERRATPTRDAITTATLATAIGVRMGLSGKTLYQLAIGGLLYDIGKLELPPELLNESRRFTPAEFKVMQSHVDAGVKILKNAQGITPVIVEMAQHHHERFNGSGYPTGLKDENIPVFARIAAIIDCFNAITSYRPHSPAMSPYNAALKLYEWRNADFDPKLVEQLIQVIGVYPIGSTVELSSGEVAIIVAHNRGKRLRPIVAVMLNKNKEPLDDTDLIDLSGEKDLSIQKAVPPGLHKVKLTGLLKRLYSTN